MTISESVSTLTPLPIAEAQSSAYREPPHNLEAEQGLLGAILVNNRAFERVSEYLSPDHFADAAHGRIFAACGQLIEKGQIANPVTLKALFDQDESLQEAGGAQYLVRLAASVVTVINADDYGQAIYDSFLRRELIDIGGEIVNEAYQHDLDLPAAEQIEVAESKLFGLAEHGSSLGGFQEFGEALTTAIRMAEAAFKREGGLAGISSGLTDLDASLAACTRRTCSFLPGVRQWGKRHWQQTSLSMSPRRTQFRSRTSGCRRLLA